MHYLDNSATTKPDEAYLERYVEICREHFYNPSSAYGPGAAAEGALKAARAAVAASIGAGADEIIFTASGSEANNIALFGGARRTAKRGGKIIVTASEHPSVFQPALALEDEGYELSIIPCPGGEPSLSALERELGGNTVLVSAMLVNNETGAVYPAREIASLIKKLAPRALFHVDAVQAFCKLPFSVSALHCDLLTVSAHKIHAPRGAGALYIKRGARIAPFILGGGQERGIRSGTENVAACAAFAAAAQEGRRELPKNAEKIRALSKYILGLLEDIPGVSLHRAASSADHIICISVPGVPSEVMIRLLEERAVYVSGGSACNMKKVVKSRILEDFGLPEADLLSALRISLSHRNEKEDADALAGALKASLIYTGRII